MWTVQHRPYSVVAGVLPNRIRNRPVRNAMSVELRIAQRIAGELGAQVGQVAAAVELLADATAAVEPASGNRKRPAAAKATKRAAARKRTVAATARKPAASKAKRSAAVASKRPSRKKTPA